MKYKSMEQHKLVTQLLEALRGAKEGKRADSGMLAEIDYAIEAGVEAPKLMEVAEALAYASCREVEGYSAGYDKGYSAGYDKGCKEAANGAFISGHKKGQEEADEEAEDAFEAGWEMGRKEASKEDAFDAHSKILVPRLGILERERAYGRFKTEKENLT